MGNDNVIEFNGKRYDAITGKLLGKSHTAVIEPLAPSVTPTLRNIDGVVRVRTAPMPALATSLSHTKHANTHRNPGRVAKAHQPQPAKTLMRRAVHKPDTKIKPAIKPQAPAEVMAKPISTVALKHSVSQVDPARKHRANQTPKSGAVRRFAPEVIRPQLAAAASAPRHHQLAETTHHTKATHSKPDIFEAAIARASSHEQPKFHHPKRGKHRRTVSVLVGLLSLLLLGGLLGYLNLNTIKLKVASARAGFSAQMPTYQPTGYVLGAVTTQSGNVSLNFRSGEKHYQLSQQPTNWNSQTLGDDIIASAGAKTIESQGRIIYIYDNTASWVSGGVRYDLTGNAELDEDDIAAIAASM